MAKQTHAMANTPFSRQFYPSFKQQQSTGKKCWVSPVLKSQSETLFICPCNALQAVSWVSDQCLSSRYSTCRSRSEPIHRPGLNILASASNMARGRQVTSSHLLQPGRHISPPPTCLVSLPVTLTFCILRASWASVSHLRN